MVDQPSPNENAGVAAPATDAAHARPRRWPIPRCANGTSATQAEASKPSKTDKAATATSAKPATAQDAKDQPADKKGAADVADPGLDDRVGRLDWMTVVPSWLVSLIFHMTVLFLLAMLVEPIKSSSTWSISWRPTPSVGQTSIRL